MSGPDSAPVRIYSPLHHISEHFVERLIECLNTCGISSVRLPSRNGEVAGDTRAKLLAFGAHVRNARSYANAAGPNVVAWPLLGWFETPLWQHRTHRTLIAIHDPEPLVRQNGLSERAAVLSAKLTRMTWPHLVTMSPEAHSITAKYFGPDRVHLAPHPMRNPAPSIGEVSERRTVLVMGQHKPARDLDAMAAIAPALRNSGWEPTVAGRGWPPIPGWRVIDRFLSESEFHEVLNSAVAVLLPYRYYFQSGVALRALEAGIPVVGRQTGFLKSILGNDFPGTVKDWNDPLSWCAAVEAAVNLREFQMDAAATYSSRGAEEWQRLLDNTSCDGS